MKGKILVTDTLFIFDEHVKKLESAGYKVERIEKPDMSEAELIDVVKGKVGYLLGGIEHVTDKVIDAADELKAISLLGVGYPWFIPGWKHALEKGILISNIPDGPTNEVAEWALTASLIMNREFLELGRGGKKQFAVTKGLEGQKVGIVGFGRIGSRISEMLQVFHPADIFYCGPHRHEDKEKQLNATYVSLEDLLAESDVIFLTVSDEAKNLLGKKQLEQMKRGSLLVNITHPGVIVEEDLLGVLEKKHIRAISDHPMSSKFDELPLSHWYCMNSSNTITKAGSQYMSDRATESLLNLLEIGEDGFQVTQ